MKNNMNRFKLFVGHWKILREDAKKYPQPWWVGGSYNLWNCFWWAWSNSGTHDLNGEYLIKVGNGLENNMK